MDKLSDLEIDAALARGRAVRAAEPRAVAARYERAAGRVVVDLANGCSFSFPPALVEGLAGAAVSDLEAVEILGAGYGLHWEALDVDVSVPGVVAGVFGTRAFMARQGGALRSEKKAAAARVNGGKGGGRGRWGLGRADVAFVGARWSVRWRTASVCIVVLV